ncbi:MAG: contractile injection system protein, VgrG/Pvc8 family [Pseudomonadota bacterium]
MPYQAPPLQSATLPEIQVGGRARPELARDLASLSMEEDIEGMKRLHFTLVAIGPRAGATAEGLNWLDGQVLDFGSELSVSMGPSDARAPVFKGKVSSLVLEMRQGRAPEVDCLAEDRLMELRLTRRFKTYESVSDADLVREIAARHGLAAQVAVDGPTHAVVQQWNQSDLAFLRERARRLAADVWVSDDGLHMAGRAQRQGSRITLIQGNNLIEARIAADLAHQRGAVRVGGYDDGSRDGIDEEAGADVVTAEAQGSRHGVEVLERAFGAGRDSHRTREVPLDGRQAASLARAAMLTRARRFVTVAGVADGTPSLGVGSLLRLERVGPMFEGEGYYVTRVRHRFDLTHGYRTHFEAERAWIGSGA